MTQNTGGISGSRASTEPSGLGPSGFDPGRKGTRGPWYVRDLTARTMRALGWTGPSIDRILITNKSGPEIMRDEGDDCVVARIQFDNRPEELGESNLADAHLIAAAPDLFEAARLFVEEYDAAQGDDAVEMMIAYDAALKAAVLALAKARGQTA